RHFEDNMVFDSVDSRLLDSGQLLRVRLVDSDATLTFKGRQRISDGVKDREEIECSVSPAEALIPILNRLGFSAMFRYQKYRTVYEVRGLSLHICLDETPIGTFLELEGNIQDIHRCAESLGCTRDQYITESYGSLYSRWCRENNLEPGNMTFE
ncbi:MAG TPA: class IV adenylate cyclase, partial [Acidobacteriota bacterium]|nr:class IV adenylate cyclase [Acidobacteriota bacterium]